MLPLPFYLDGRSVNTGDFGAIVADLWGYPKGLRGAKKTEVSQKLGEKFLGFLEKNGRGPNVDEVIVIHNEAFEESGLPASAWAGNIPFFGRHALERLINEGEGEPPNPASNTALEEFLFNFWVDGEIPALPDIL